MSKPVIAVIGSAMMDLTAYSHIIPEPGQTIIGELFTTGFGGKGANQAVMAALCGAKVSFIGSIGRDLFGDLIAENFQKLGVDSAGLQRSNTPTGVAHIWVDGEGENRIIVIPGSNHEIAVSKAISSLNEIENLSVVVAQCEIRQNVTLAVFTAAKARGAITILNPAPFEALSDELLARCDWLIPNETEFKYLTDVAAFEDENLTGFRSGKNSIVTLGARGAVLISADGAITRIPAPKVSVVDTTGAGDAFVGSFAYGLAHGMHPERAVKLGISVASMSVSKKGAQSSYPTQAEIAMLS